MQPKREQKPGQGVLFINMGKQGMQPDYKGTLTLDQDYKAGEQIQISAWKKDTSAGHLISMSVNNYKKDQYPKRVVIDDNEVPF